MIIALLEVILIVITTAVTTIIIMIKCIVIGSNSSGMYVYIRAIVETPSIPLIAPMMVPYIIPHIIPLKEFRVGLI